MAARVDKYSRWRQRQHDNVMAYGDNVMVITLCLIWLSKHVKENRNSVSTYLLRYSILVTSIYLGQ